MNVYEFAALGKPFHFSRFFLEIRSPSSSSAPAEFQDDKEKGGERKTPRHPSNSVRRNNGSGGGERRGI